MEQRNITEWSEHSEYRELTIPSGEIWMSESELVDLFGVFIPKLRNTIQTLYKEVLVKPYEAERSIKQSRNLYLTVYNMEVVLLLAFRLNSYQARAIRKELMGRIERDHKPFEVILTASRGTGGLM
jgi:stress response protein SCP2